MIGRILIPVLGINDSRCMEAEINYKALECLQRNFPQ